MKIAFLVYFNLENTELLGVKKKILHQVDALKELGHEVELLSPSNGKLSINQLETNVILKKGKSNYRYSFYKLFKNIEFHSKYEAIYIRFPGSIDINLYNTIKYLKKKDLKIYLEMPTYPIGSEIVSYLKLLQNQKKYPELFLRFINYSSHILLSRSLKGNIDKIVTFMPYEYIWGIKTIIIDNGINPRNFKPRNNTITSINNELILIGVANVSKWHGFDRVIEGLNNYYTKYKESPKVVKFNIIGNGPEIANLKEMVNKYNLSEYVFFGGQKSGDELKEFYSNSHVGISSLGMFRIRLSNGSTLKTKEYCAIGIPFVYGYNEMEINDDFPFAYKVSNDNVPINIDEVIFFFNKVSGIEQYELKMNKFASEKFDWRHQMNKVF